MSPPNESNVELIIGRVATILNSRELVINKGSISGVKLGMKFKVLAEKPIEIFDPGTGEELGIVDREKIRVQAVDVQERLTVCKTYQTMTIGGGGFLTSALIESMGSPPRKVPETLKADSASFPPPLSEEESYVKTGDRVIQLTKVEMNSE